MSTEQNLKEAFAGKSQANRTYLAFAKKAEDEGFSHVAKLFRATAEAETIHAHAHLRNLGKIKRTAENLAAAAEGERHEFRSMYPRFLAEAKAEGASKAVLTSLHNARAAEEVHHGLYTKALEAVEAGQDLDTSAIYLCPFCGNIEIGEVPEICSICGVPGNKFVEAV